MRTNFHSGYDNHQMSALSAAHFHFQLKYQKWSKPFRTTKKENKHIQLNQKDSVVGINPEKEHISGRNIPFPS